MDQYPKVEFSIDTQEDIHLFIDGRGIASWSRDGDFPNLTRREVAIIQQMVTSGIEYGKRLKADQINKALGITN